MISSVQPNYKDLLLRKSVYLFFGKAMPVIILFLIAILYSRRLAYDEYGRFQSVWMYTNIINVIISFGATSVLLSSNLSFLLAFVKRHAKKVAAFYTALWTLVLMLFLFYGRNLSPVLRYLLILFVIIQNAGTVLETLLLKYHREKFVFVLNVMYSVLFFLWHYYILSTGYSLQNLIIGIILIALAKSLIMVFVKGREEPLIQLASDRVFARHWIFLGLNDATGVLSKWIDKLLLLYLLAPADFAIFFNGSFEIPLFGLLISVTGSVMLIEMSKGFSSNEKIQHLFNESFQVLQFIVFPLFLFLLFFRADLFAIVFKNKYDASLPVFVISIFILPARINNYSSILQYYQKGNKIMAGSILDIFISLALMISLYPVFGTRGVAMAVVIATYCQVIYYLWQSAKILNTGILSLLPLKALCATFITLLIFFAGVSFALSELNRLPRLVTGAVITAITILTGLFFYFSKKSPRIYGLTTKI